MSDISRTPAASQQTQQEQSVSQEQSSQKAPQEAPQEAQRRFAQKLKKERDEKSSAKESSKEASKESSKEASKEASKESSKESSRASSKESTEASAKASAKADEKQQHLSNIVRQAAEKAQKASDHPPSQSLDEEVAKHSSEEQSKASSDKADAILQGLQPQSTTSPAAQQTQQASAPVDSSNRLLEEFQTVADRVMHTSQSLQQGGSVRLQLSGNVLPGTSVTFSMVAGALHVTFSGNNKKSLAKVREHEAGLTSHVRRHSGVDIVVATEDQSAPDQQQEGSPSEGSL